MFRSRITTIWRAVCWIFISSTLAFADGTIVATPNPIELPPAGQTINVDYRFQVFGLSNIDSVYGIHGFGSPTGPGDKPLSGYWEDANTFKATYPLSSNDPTGTYSYRAQSEDGSEVALGSLEVIANTGGGGGSPTISMSPNPPSGWVNGNDPFGSGVASFGFSVNLNGASSANAYQLWDTNSANDTRACGTTSFNYNSPLLSNAVQEGDLYLHLCIADASDSAKNGTAVYHFQTDNTPPSAPVNLQATVISGTEIDLSWTSATDNIGVAGYIVDRADVGNLTTSLGPSELSYADINLTAGVTYDYTVKARDVANNQQGATKSATTNSGDGSIAVTLTKPTDGQTFSIGDSVALEAIASGGSGGIQNVQFIIDQGTSQEVVVTGSLNGVTHRWQGAWSMTSGAHQVQARAFDTGTYADTGYTNITEGSSGISVVVVTPTDGQSFAVGDSVALAATASGGAGGIQNVQFLIDQGTAQEVVITGFLNGATGRWETSWSMTSGSHKIQARAFDTGTYADTGYTNITEQTSGINVVLVKPVEGQTFAIGDSVQLQATASGGVGGIQLVQFIIDPASGSPLYYDGSFDGTKWTAAWTMTAGDHQVQAVAYDTVSPGQGTGTVNIREGTATDTTPPNAPTNVHTTNVTSNRVDLAWDASFDPDDAVGGYHIFRDDGAGGALAQIGTATASPTPSYSDGTVNGGSSGKTYLYAVTAYDSVTPVANESAQSMPLSVAVPAVINDNPTPTLTSLQPSSETAGRSTDLLLTVKGTNFVPNAVVVWKGADMVTTFVSDTELSAIIPSAKFAQASTVLIAVRNPLPGTNLTSNTLPFSIGMQPTLGLQKAYGVQVLADLTILSPKSNTFARQVCSTLSPSSCSNSGITWTIVDNGGDVGDPGNSMRNDQGWLYADQFIEISNVDTNARGWFIQVYTDNLTAYSGPLVDKTASPAKVSNVISGLVSSGGEFIVPLSWKLESCTGGICPNLNPNPVPPNVPNAPPAKDQPSTNQDIDICSQQPQPFTRFSDFATHFISDKNDVDTNPLNFLQKTWWETINDTCRKGIARNYQSILDSDGAATAEYYRTPYSTLSTLAGVGKFAVRIAAKLAPGTIKEDYTTKIYLELVTQ